MDPELESMPTDYTAGLDLLSQRPVKVVMQTTAPASGAVKRLH
jgi:hypothetical protein